MIGSFKKITIETKPIYDAYISRLKQPLCSYLDFIYIIAWEFLEIFYYDIIEGYFCMIYFDNSQNINCCFPIGEYEEKSFVKCVNKLNDLFEQNGIRLKFKWISEWMLEYFSWLGNKYAILQKYNSESSDYVYTKKKYIEHYYSRNARRNLRWLTSRYNMDYKIINSLNIKECYEITNKFFCKYHSCRDCLPCCEKQVMKKLISKYEQLNCKGIIITADDENIGYSIVSSSNDTFSVLFEKTKHFGQGVGVYISRQVMDQFLDSENWINVSCDMGISGLSTNKSYISDYVLFKVYTVEVKRAM